VKLIAFNQKFREQNSALEETKQLLEESRNELVRKQQILEETA
jgi:hypothetical protein